jgi:hypothetical protein
MCIIERRLFLLPAPFRCTLPFRSRMRRLNLTCVQMAIIIIANSS